jgi:hypothetical protein
MSESICIDYILYWLKDQDKNKYNNKSQYICNARAISKIADSGIHRYITHDQSFVSINKSTSSSNLTYHRGSSGSKTAKIMITS